MRTLALIVVLAPFAALAQKTAAPPLALPGMSPADSAETLLPLPAPAQPQLDLELLLKNTSLCVFPFVKESARATDRAYLDSIQKTFFDVAKESPILKDAVLLSQQTNNCPASDTECIANLGKLARCQNVLVGTSQAKGNGYVLSVRIVDVNRKHVVPDSEVEQVLETDRQSDVQAWAEGQACRSLKVKCVGHLYVDADRKDMNIYVDNRLAPRSFKTPEAFGVLPGVHEVRVSIGQRTSLAKKIAIRRNVSSDLIYARQTDKGGIPLYPGSDLNGRPPPHSVEYSEGSWTKPVGLTVAGAGAIALGIGVAEGLHGKSLMNQANDNYTKNKVYLQGDLANIDSAKSATSTGNILIIAGAVLIAAGLTTAIVF